MMVKRYLNPKKKFIALICSCSGFNFFLKFIRSLLFGDHVRVINYHDIDKSMLDSFEKQLKWFRKNYVNADREVIESLLKGKWKSTRPGLAITFDDGLRSQYEYVLPLLEKYGFTGWFFVPVQFVETNPSDQMSFGEKNQITIFDHEFEDERFAMNWDEVKKIDSSGHHIGSHTLNHKRLSENLREVDMQNEIVKSKYLLEKKLNKNIDIFCWVGGEEESYSQKAADLIKKSGYKLSFMTNNLPIKAKQNPLQLQRTNIEAWYPPYLVRFQLNGILDLIYYKKRRRVNLLTE